VKILLVQWDEEAANRRAVQLRDAGFEVLCETEDGANAYRTARREQPDAVVLDLDQKPSHSCQTARPLAKPSSPPRIIFVGGDESARSRAAQLAPAATFVDPDELKSALA
jgi:DNA-binding response OmpR family regulator